MNKIIFLIILILTSSFVFAYDNDLESLFYSVNNAELNYCERGVTTNFYYEAQNSENNDLYGGMFFDTSMTLQVTKTEFEDINLYEFAWYVRPLEDGDEAIIYYFSDIDSQWKEYKKQNVNYRDGWAHYSAIYLVEDISKIKMTCSGYEFETIVVESE